MPKYFSNDDFVKCTPSCSISDIDSISLLRLDALRCLCGFPLRVNSAFRTVEYEKQHGRDGSSSHTKGCAFDISCLDSRKRAIIVAKALEVNFKRIGISKTFIHLDDDSSKPGPSIWLYDY